MEHNLTDDVDKMICELPLRLSFINITPSIMLIDTGIFFYFFFFFFFFFFFATVLSQWDFSHGKFGLPSLRKASCDRVALSNLRCKLGVLVFP